MSTRSLHAIIASGLLFGMSVAMSPVALAVETDTGSGSLSGTNPEIGEIAVTTPTIASLSQSSTTTSTGGKVNIKSNAALGFTLTVTSVNSGKIINGDNSIGYTLGYNGGAGVTLTGGADPLESPDAMDATCSTTAGCDRALAVTVAATSGKAAGTYTDTLNFNFTNK